MTQHSADRVARATHVLEVEMEPDFDNMTLRPKFRVRCLVANLRNARPCATWDDEDGKERLDECFYETWFSDYQGDEYVRFNGDWSAVKWELPVVLTCGGEEPIEVEPA